MDFRSGTAVRTFLGPAESAGSADEGRGLVVEEVFARIGVFGDGAGCDDGGGAFVHDFDQFRVGGGFGGGGDGEFADFEVLFAVQEHHHAEVGDDVG